jgi:hypothetical protein
VYVSLRVALENIINLYKLSTHTRRRTHTCTYGVRRPTCMHTHAHYTVFMQPHTHTHTRPNSVTARGEGRGRFWCFRQAIFENCGNTSQQDFGNVIKNELSALILSYSFADLGLKILHRITV